MLDNVKLLIADDDRTSREALSKIFNKHGANVVETTDGHDAIEKMDSDVEIAFVDIRMPLADGFACLQNFRKRFPNTPVIMVSSADIDNAVKAMRDGAFSFVKKPFNVSQVIDETKNALVQKKQRIGEVTKDPLTDIGGVKLENLQREAIIQTLGICNGNKAAAARLLGISERSIYNKIKKLNIEE